MSHVDRRAFLKTTGCCAAALLGGSLHSTQAAPQVDVPRPCAPSDWQKHGVVLPADEHSWVQNFTCAVEPLADERWRLWYSGTGPKGPFEIGFAEGQPGKPFARHLAVLSSGEPADAPLAIGNLPDGWHPVQPVHVKLADGRHRLYFWAHGPKVVRYLAAESSDGRRYKVLDPLRPCLYHPNDRAVDGPAAAAAGLSRWAKKVAACVDGEPAAPAALLSNDATNVYRLADGSFEMYSVALVEVAKDDPRHIAHDNAAGWVRVIDRYASADGLHWDQRRRVLVPDAQDPADQQFYFLSVTHTARGRVGIVGHYRVQAQTMDLEYCFSHDGIAWQRPARSGWLPRGEPGQADSYGVYAPNAIVERGGQWHLFYTGVTEAHNHKHAHGKPASAVLYATTKSLWRP